MVTHLLAVSFFQTVSGCVRRILINTSELLTNTNFMYICVFILLVVWFYLSDS